MNFKSIIDQQILLDKAIKEAHKINQDYSNQMIIALYTEVGEFANEIQSFKYWKKSKNIDQNNLLEEFADGLHFLISFAIKTNCNYIIEPLVLSNDINYQLLEMFKSIYKLSKKISRRNVTKCIAIYIGIAKILNIEDDLIIESYMLKTKKNFERIKNNY